MIMAINLPSSQALFYLIMSINLGQILLNLNLTKIWNGQKHYYFQHLNPKFQIELKSGAQSRNLNLTHCFCSKYRPTKICKKLPHTTYGAKPSRVWPMRGLGILAPTVPHHPQNRRPPMTHDTTRGSTTVPASQPTATTQIPTLLCLDLGTATGWALTSERGSIASGTARFQPRRFEGGGMRYLRFKRWLTETKNVTGNIDAVYFEEVRRHAGVDAAHAYGGFLAHLTAWCEHHTIPYEGVPVGTIKRFITGKGNADKQAVIAAITARGHTPEDDNEADALAILYWATQQHNDQRGA